MSAKRTKIALEEPEDTTPPTPPTPPKRRRNTVRYVTFEKFDRRCAAFRETKRLIGEIEADLGGTDRLSTAERQLVQRGGVLGAILTDMEARWLSGEKIDVSMYCGATNTMRRVLESVGLKRRPRDVTRLSTYLANIPAEEAAP
jgi:hypothetical protein